MRYHLHPLTGQAALCKAQVRCPFGDLEADHYDSAEAAQAAYEAKMEALTFPRVPARSHGPLAPHLLAEGEGFVNSLPPGELRTLGKRLLSLTVSAPTWHHYRARADALCEELVPGFGPAREVVYFMEALNNALAEDVSEETCSEELAKAREKLEAHQKLTPPPPVEASASPLEQEEAKYQGEKFARERRLREARVAMWEPESVANQRQGIRDSLQATRKKAEGLSLAPPRGSIFSRESLEVAYTEGEEQLADYLGRGYSSIPGRVSAEDYRKACAKLGAISEALVGLATVEGRYVVPRAWQKLAPETGFRLLAAGSERNAYLHEESGMVFKVMHSRNGKVLRRWEDDLASPRGEEREEGLQRMRLVVATEDQERYAGVNDELLAKNEARYLPTYFLTVKDEAGQEVAVMAQPYLDPQRYRPLREGDFLEASQDFPSGVTDVHDENAYLDTATGEFILFDCIF